MWKAPGPLLIRILVLRLAVHCFAFPGHCQCACQSRWPVAELTHDSESPGGCSAAPGPAAAAALASIGQRKIEDDSELQDHDSHWMCRVWEKSLRGACDRPQWQCQCHGGFAHGLGRAAREFNAEAGAGRCPSPGHWAIPEATVTGPGSAAAMILVAASERNSKLHRPVHFDHQEAIDRGRPWYTSKQGP